MILGYALANRRRVLGLLVAVAAVATSAAWLKAGETGDTPSGRFVMRTGRKIAVTRSTTKFGVVFRNVRDVPTVSARMRTLAGGKVKDFNGHRDSRVKVIEVPETTAARRQLIEQDPSVESVQHMYRFATASKWSMGTSTVLVRAEPDLAGDKLDALWKDYGVTLIGPQDGFPNTFLVKPARDEDEVVVAERLADDPRTIWAQANFRNPIHTLQIMPQDEYYPLQWHLNNTNQGTGTGGADINAPEAWEIANGQDVLLGMFDDSCDVGHPDLAAGYIGIGHDPTVSSSLPGYKDPSPKQPHDNHGTRVMGLAAARANSIGIRGVAYQARFTASRGLNSNLTDAQLATVYTFALQQGVDVHINSWGFEAGVPNPAVVEDNIQRAYEEGRAKVDLNNDGVLDPLGMVIVFASGNSDLENQPGLAISTLPWVISVGASQYRDARASYSNYGDTLNFLAPSGDDNEPGLVTTDNRDIDIADPGANVGGVNVEDPNNPTEVDAAGNYTEYFAGTSGACPIAAGVAALVISANPLLTADDVRIIMEHTANPINSSVAHYDPVTGRSLKYGYGRVDAYGAADAAANSALGANVTWPDAPADVCVNVDTQQLVWRQNVGTTEFLVLQSDSPFTADPGNPFPKDAACYDRRQSGCASAPLQALPAGVSILAIGCDLACGGGVSTSCDVTEAKCVDFQIGSGTRYFAIYGRNPLGRYSFGVAADSLGNVTNSGVITLDPMGGPDCAGSSTNSGDTGTSGVHVTISAAPREGDSPLSVQFRGNAVSVDPIDESRTVWDFGDGMSSSKRTVVHEYTVAAGESRTFTATFTMYDTQGRSDSDTVTILVHGAETSDQGTAGIGRAPRITVGTPDNPQADIKEGTSPLLVQVSLDTGTISGTLQSVRWDLGDGTILDSLTAEHTYVNTSGRDQRLVITGVMSLLSSSNTTTTSTASAFLTLHTGTAETNTGTPNLPGTGTSGGSSNVANLCGTAGMIPLLLVMAALVSLRWIRRRDRV